MKKWFTIREHVQGCVGCVQAVGTCRVLVWVNFISVVVEEGVMAAAESGKMDTVLSRQGDLGGVNSRRGEVKDLVVGSGLYILGCDVVVYVFML